MNPLKNLADQINIGNQFNKIVIEKGKSRKALALFDSVLHRTLTSAVSSPEEPSQELFHAA